MSYEQVTSVYSVSSNSFRNEFANLTDFEGFQRTHEEQLAGKSRSGWMNDVIEKLLNLHSFPALVFLGATSSRGDQRIPYFEDDPAEGQYLLTYLSGERLLQVHEQLTALVSLARTDVSEISDLMTTPSYGGWQEEDIRNAALESIISDRPYDDSKVRWGSDGDTPWYLFTYIRTLQKLCLNAQANDCTLVFVEMDGM